MRNKKIIIAVIIAVLLLILLVLIFNSKSDHHKISNEVFVNVAEVLQQDTVVNIDTVGNVEAYATVSIKSLVDGQLLKVGFKEGDFVTAGQVLFSIDPRPYEAALGQTKANLSHDQAQLKSATLLLERNSKLVNKGYVSKQDFDQLQADHDALVATVKADQAVIDNAKLQLSYCTIEAPLSGSTGNLLVDAGNLVKASDQNALVVINQIDPIYVRFSVPEKQFALVQKEIHEGPIKVQAKLAQEGDVSKEGLLDFIDNTVDTQTGMIQLKATFANKDHYFWPGQFVRVILPITSLPKALLVPTRAVQVGQNGYYVFVIANNRAKIRPVTLGPVVKDNTVINKGLQRGELVITEGQLHLLDGMQVKYH